MTIPIKKLSKEQLEEIELAEDCIEVLKTQWRDFIPLGATPALRDKQILELEEKIKKIKKSK